MTAAGRRELRGEFTSRIPSWYSPWAHLLGPTLVGLALLGASLASLRDVRPWQVALVPLFWVVGNAFEWRAHRDLLHRRMRPFEVLYVRHAQHHAVFVTEDMAIRDVREFKLVLLPAYGVLGIFAFTALSGSLFFLAGQRNLGLLWLATAVAYVLSYEWLHLSYHLPPDSLVGGLRLVRALRRHHATHHAPALMQRYDFNVTGPLWDAVRGTTYRATPRPAPVAGRAAPSDPGARSF